MSTQTVAPSISAAKMLSGSFSEKAMCFSVIKNPSTVTFPSRSIAVFRAAASAATIAAFTFDPSLPKSGPMPRITGSADQPIRSHAPRTTVTALLLARWQARSFISVMAVSTASLSVITYVSLIGQRSLRPPFWRAVATASSKERISSISASRVASMSASSPANHGSM